MISPDKNSREKVDWREEQKAKLCQLEIKKKWLQRETLRPESFRNHQINQQIVYDQLAASKKEQATTTALAKEQTYVSGVAKTEAEGPK